MKRARCECGKVRRKAMPRCDSCEKVRRDARLEEGRKIVAGGTCPRCSRPLKQNLSLQGWYQCVQFGAKGFRKDAESPSCNFQTFV